MATRSTISIKEGNKVRTVYCHWDGYLTGVGQKLLDHYSKPKKVRKLIALGSISSLQRKLKSKKTDEYIHTFNSPNFEVTVAYHRDRGEDLEISEMELPKRKKYDSCLAEGFEYLYDVENKKWMVKTSYKGYWKELTQRKINAEKDY